MKIKDIIKIISIPVFAASLCCLSPLILVLAGLSTVSFAASLADTFYGDYRWLFRGIGIVFLIISTVLYLRSKKNICTLDEAKRRQKEVINTILLVLISGVIGYIFFLYVVVHYAGAFWNLWDY